MMIKEVTVYQTRLVHDYWNLQKSSTDRRDCHQSSRTFWMFSFCCNPKHCCRDIGDPSFWDTRKSVVNCKRIKHMHTLSISRNSSGSNSMVLAQVPLGAEFMPILVVKSCPTLQDLMDHIMPGNYVKTYQIVFLTWHEVLNKLNARVYQFKHTQLSFDLKNVAFAIQTSGQGTKYFLTRNISKLTSIVTLIICSYTHSNWVPSTLYFLQYENITDARVMVTSSMVFLMN